MKNLKLATAIFIVRHRILIIFSGLKNILHFASASRGVGRMGRSCERSLKMTTENESQNKKKKVLHQVSINRSSYLRNTLDCMHVHLVTFIYTVDKDLVP